VVNKLLKKDVHSLSDKAVQMVQDKDVTAQPGSLHDGQSAQQTDMSDTPLIYQYMFYMLFYYHLQQVQEMDDDVEGRSKQHQLPPVNMADMLKHVSSIM